MRRFLVLWLLATLLLVRPAETVLAQVGGGHTLFGDFKVDESKVGGIKPQTFQVVLYSVSSNLVIARQTVTNNGRYRFFDVRNGEYNLIVEMGNEEVTRIHLWVNEIQRTDIRHDIHLEWTPGPEEKDRRQVGTVSAKDFYNRLPANKTLFHNAQEAMRKNDYALAAQLFAKIASADAKDFQAWTELGTAHFKQENLGEAEKAYVRALEEDPSYFLAMLNLGKLHSARKNYETAIEILSRAVEVQQSSAEANYFLGESYLQIKKGSKAEGYLNAAIRLDPIGKAEAHLRLAALYNAVGLKAKAVAEYEQFLVKVPDHPAREKIRQYISDNKKQ